MTREPMFEYKIEKCPTNKWGTKIEEDYKAIIFMHAKEGWRLIEIFNRGIGGIAGDIDMIFERPVRM